MHININARVPLARTSEMDFVVPILAEVVAPSAFEEGFDEDVSRLESDVIGSSQALSEEREALEHAAAEFNSEEASEREYIVGRVWAERLDWFLAESMGFSPVVICDSASATWLQVYETLTARSGRGFRKDLNLDEFYSDLIFVHEFLIHPDITDRIAILDAALTGFSKQDSLILMYHEQGLPHHIDDWEYRDLGFKKIARSGLLIRDNHFRYPFGDKHEGGREVDFVATAEHEEWLLEHWEHLVADHPSL